MDNITVTTGGDREIKLSPHPFNEDVKVCLLVKELDGCESVSAGLDLEETLKLVKGLVEVAGIPWQTIEKFLQPPKYYYVLPKLFIKEPSERYLNSGLGLAFSTKEETANIKTQFTEEEFRVLTEEHADTIPELSVLVKEEI